MSAQRQFNRRHGQRPISRHHYTAAAMGRAATVMMQSDDLQERRKGQDLLLRLPVGEVPRKETLSQRQQRRNRRRAWAAGVKAAFA